MDGIKSGVVLVSKFVSAGDKKFKGYIDYIARSSAVRNDAYSRYSINSLKSELRKYENYMDYMDDPEKTSELFTAEKDRLDLEEKTALKRAFEIAQKNDSLMWQTVISFDNRWLIEQGLYDADTKTVNEAKLKECARGAMERIIEKENLSSSAIWSGAIHYNTKHLHIHLAMTEPLPTREIIQQGEFAGQRKGKFKKATLESAKSFIVNNIINQKESNKNINEIIRENLVTAMENSLVLDNKELYHLYIKILEQLPEEKRFWQYNRNMLNKVRPDIDRFISTWLDENHKEELEKLKKELHQQQIVYQTAYGTKKDEDASTYEENKIKELYSRLGNTLLKNMKNMAVPPVPDDILSEADVNKIIDNEILDSDNASDTFNEPIDVELLSDTETRQKTEDFNQEATENSDFIPLGTYAEFSKEYKEARSLIYQKDTREKAFLLMKEEAIKGNSFAIYDIAHYYSKGLGCEIDIDLSEKLYSNALESFIEILSQIENTLYISNMRAIKTREYQISYFSYRIAKMYYFGLGTEINKELAYEYFKISDEIKGGNMFSHYYLARFYENGEVVEKDLNTAFNYYLDVANETLSPQSKKSMPYAVYKVATMIENGTGCEKDDSKAQDYYKEALNLFEISNASRPDDQLQYRIGKMYLDGKGCTKDMEKALKFLKSSANLGNDFANYTLAMIYLKDEQADPELIKKAIDMLTISASKKNNPLAQYQLGSILLESSPEKAIEYLEMSAMQGNQFAQYKLGVYYLSSDTDKAINYLKSAAEQGNVFANYRLGMYYIKIKEKSEDEIFYGIKYLTAAAEQNNCFAEYQLGKFYSDGVDTETDFEKAEQYLLKALSDRSKDFEEFTFIEHRLGNIYFTGDENVPQDIEKGIKFYTTAAEKGNQFSQYKLGAIYFYGLNNVKRDIDLAKYYLEKSAAQGNTAAETLLNKANNPYQKDYTPPPYYAKTLLSDLNIGANFQKLLRELGREYKDYDNYINQQIYEQAQQETEAENKGW
ncbi:MAG: relaxase MobL [Ruminococcus sp.]|nr:relaxase MobL [Ruminococcus sp.]